jgi:4'-phosphopantetheinyl transferase
VTGCMVATAEQSGRSRIAEHGAHVTVWLVRHAQHSGHASMEWLDEDERARASAFRRDDDRAAFVLTKAALRRVLSNETGIPPSEWTFSVSRVGKPEIADRHGRPDVRFSVSHTEGLSLIAVAHGRSVGVDVERYRPIADIETIAAKAFNAQVAARLRALPADERTTAFLRCWTLGEAFGKATGLGIVGLGGKFPVAFVGGSAEPCIADYRSAQPNRRWHSTPLDAGSGYVATLVCERGAEVPPRVRTLADIPAASLGYRS